MTENWNNGGQSSKRDSLSSQMEGSPQSISTNPSSNSSCSKMAPKKQKFLNDNGYTLEPDVMHKYLLNMGLNTKLRDIPLHSTKVRVFILNPGKNINGSTDNWLPISRTEVTVSFYYDKSRQIYRILSFEDGKILINSVVTCRMHFHKLSSLFGKWTDLKANAVYGLGFLTDMDLDRFGEAFDELLQVLSHNGNESRSGATPRLTQSYHPSLERNQSTDTNASSSFKRRDSSCGRSPLIPRGFKCPNTFRSVQNSPKRQTPLWCHSLIPLETRLKLENEKLKMALTLNSENVKKYENELVNLKSKNENLNQELERSNTKIADLHDNLTRCQERCSHLDCKLKDIYLSKNLIKTLKVQIDKLMQQVQNLDDKFQQDFENISEILQTKENNRMNEEGMPTVHSVSFI